ncbi:MAG: hypothetical protein V3V08_15475 [Nannocystaceae bacterium]
MNSPSSTVFATYALTVGLLGACSQSEHTQEVHFDQAIREVVLDVDYGRLRIRGDDRRGVAMLAYTSWEGRGEVAAEASVNGGQLRIDVTCPRAASPCDAAIQLVVPRDAAIVAFVGGGDVAVEKTVGSLDLSVGSGSVTLGGVGGRTSVVVERGDVVGMELRSGTAWAETGVGDLHLQFAEAPEEVSASTDVGDVSIGVPKGFYNVYADASAGEVNLDICLSAQSERRIFVRSGIGDVAVCQ